MRCFDEYKVHFLLIFASPLVPYHITPKQAAGARWLKLAGWRGLANYGDDDSFTSVINSTVAGYTVRKGEHSVCAEVYSPCAHGTQLQSYSSFLTFRLFPPS